MKRFLARPIDRAVFAILATLHVADGLYLIGPWYLGSQITGNAALHDFFHAESAVGVYGSLLVLDGAVLFYSAVNRKCYARLLSNALLAGFLLRLYVLIGVMITLESWRPPSYVPNIAMVLLMAAYWLHVRAESRERIT